MFSLDIALQAAKLDPGRVRGLTDALGLDADRLAAFVDAPWTTLGLKLGVLAVGTALVFRWLLRNTRADGDGEPLPRRDFVRRFCVLIVVNVSINTTWHFFRAWQALFLQEQYHFSESAMYWFNAAYYLSADFGSLAAGFTALYLARRGLSVHASRAWVFAACALGTSLSVTAAVVRQERLLMGLRTTEGVAFQDLAALPITEPKLMELARAGLIAASGGRLYATSQGRLVLDRVTAELAGG